MEKNSYYKEWAQNNPFWDSAWYHHVRYHSYPGYREEKKEYDKQYYKDHREEKKQYYKDHREEKKEYFKQYHKDHFYKIYPIEYECYYCHTFHQYNPLKKISKNPNTNCPNCKKCVSLCKYFQIKKMEVK